MLTDKKAIQSWLQSVSILAYSINKDFTVDVMGNVNLSYQKLTHIPIQFGVIKGYFNALCNDFTSFEGFPLVVEGNFQCHLNNDIDFSSFKTQKITKNFFCLSQINEENLKKFLNSGVAVQGKFSHLTHHEEDIISLFKNDYLVKKNKNNTQSYVLDVKFSQFKDVMNSQFEKELLDKVISEKNNSSMSRVKL